MPLQLLQSLGWALLNSLWQMALLWVVYQCIMLCWQSSRPVHKANLAASLLFAGFGWFLLNFIVAFAAISAGDTLSSPLASALVSQWLSKGLPWISVFYLVILLFPVLRFIKNYRYVQVIRSFGLSKIGVDWRLFVRNTAERMNIGRKVEIWVSAFVQSPVTIGYLKPVILVPLAAINQLSPQQLEAILLHELAHIRRSDYLVNLLLNSIRTILYFNPFVKALVRIVEQEREKSCDELVLQFQYDAHAYATALLTLEKTKPVQPVFFMAAKGQEPDLLQRVEAILGMHKKPAVTRQKITGLLSLIMGILALNLLLLLPGQTKSLNNTILADNIMMNPMDMVFSPQETVQTEAEFPQTLATEAVSIESPNEKSTSFPEAISAEQTDPAAAASEISPLAYRLAGFDEVQIPVLMARQEAQVKEALAASKRVLENAQWKEVEKSIADAFNEQEKSEIRKVYQKELNNFDWNKLEKNLKIAYSKIDWENVNSQLNTALNQIRLDSIQHVYNDVALRLAEVQRELNENKITSIPDSDISLQLVEDKRQKVQESLNKLKNIRAKKIVRL